MTISGFKEKYGNNAKLIPTDSIVLTEECHKKAVADKDEIHSVSSPICIVRDIGNGFYSLLVGFSPYMTAINSSSPQILAIIVQDKDRKSFLLSLALTPEFASLSFLRAPRRWTTPSPEKIHSCVEKYQNIGVFGKRIIISPTGTIIDGYSAVCAAKQLKLERVPVHIISNNMKKFLKGS